MTRYRTLGMSRESCCCLPTPYRIPKAVAGMAFNFSLAEVAPRRNTPAEALDGSYGTERRVSPLFRFALPRYAHAT
jgi:hypothetical protein